MTRKDLISQGVTKLLVKMPVPCCDFDICGLPQELENSINYDKKTELFSIKIDLIDKLIENWEEEYGCGEVDIFVKAVDCGEYCLLNDKDEIIYSLHGYVPGILDFGGNSFGDYIEMFVDAKGFIDWADVEFDLEKDRWQKGEWTND